MTKPVKVVINPSAEVQPSKYSDFSVTDDLGRKITVKKPDILARMRFFLAIGAEASANDVYTQMCAPILYLKSIDDEDVPQPKTLLQVEALMQRLGEEGLSGIGKGVQKFILPQAEEDSDVKLKK